MAIFELTQKQGPFRPFSAKQAYFLWGHFSITELDFENLARKTSIQKI